MKRRILFITSILILLVLCFTGIYRHKLRTEKDISHHLHNHYATLTHIVSDIERYSNNSLDTNDTYIKNIGGLLGIAWDFSLSQISYENAYNKSKRAEGGIGFLLNNYYNLFVKSVDSTDKVDYETLDMIKNDLEKWVVWIEENYIYTDQDRTYVKMYTYKDMEESGLIDELELGDFGRHPESLRKSRR